MPTPKPITRAPVPLPPPGPEESQVDFGSWSLVSSADPMSSLGSKVQELLAAPPTAPAARATSFRNFEVVSRLGRGGMAEVFYARALAGPLKGQPVAIKRVLPEMAKNKRIVDLFATEANLSVRLNHPNIVRTYEVGAHESEYFLVMELVDGRNVGQLIQRCRRLRIMLPADFALFLVKTLLDALDYAHNLELVPGQKLGLVHRDVSPSNLFVSRVGDIKLGDFGLAAVGASGQSNDRGLVGKPMYLSPEALDGDQSAARDLWAAAVMLYELLALHRPFEADSPDLVIGRIRRGDLAPLATRRPDLAPEVAAIVHRALSQDPKQRFPTAAEFASALERCFDPAVGTPLAIAAVVRGLFGEVAKSS
jgi:serine/threonine-protein kinase